MIMVMLAGNAMGNPLLGVVFSCSANVSRNMLFFFWKSLGEMGGKWGYGWFLQYISPVMIRVFVQNFMAVFISFRVKSEVLKYGILLVAFTVFTLILPLLFRDV